jgi:hypothetical protein
MQGRIIRGSSWLAIALSTGQSSAEMPSAFSNNPARSAGWEKLESHGVIKEVTDNEALRERAVEQHLKALRDGKTSLMISPRHEEARKIASIVRERLKAEGAIGLENYSVSILRRMDLEPKSCRDLLHYVPGRVVEFHTRTAGGFRPGEKWTVREANCETVTLECNGRARQFKPPAKGKWDVLVASTMKVSVGDQIRVTGGFRRIFFFVCHATDCLRRP